MTIREAQTEKRKTELIIRTALRDFEVKTGLVVKAMRFASLRGYEAEVSEVQDVRLDVSLWG